MKVTIHFDGGCSPNPGKMYGSFSLTVDGSEVFSTTQDFGQGTNNVAEFMAFHKALLKTLDLCDCNVLNTPARECELEIFTDSMIVRNRINNPEFKVKKKYANSAGVLRMNEWQRTCLVLLRLFKAYKITWNSREVNVEKFGH